MGLWHIYRYQPPKPDNNKNEGIIGEKRPCTNNRFARRSVGIQRAALPLLSGESLVLTLNDAYFDAGASWLNLLIGAGTAVLRPGQFSPRHI
ncbi:MAG: hypothetical protein GY805_06605 [Chloroflexi bacterium]|nr:hypothetical protein [Chloroflexota bacterium]